MPTRRARLVAALCVAVAVAAYLVHFAAVTPGWRPDLEQARFAARVAAEGRNPYVLGGPAGAYPMPWPIAYPMTAAAAVLPVAWLPGPPVWIAFAAVSAFALALAVTSPTAPLTRGRPWWLGLLAFASAAYGEAARDAQWTPLLLASLAFPPLAALAVCKPTTGLAVLLAALPSGRRAWAWAAAGGALLGAVSLSLYPGWPLAWWGATRQLSHITPPVARFGGPLLLLAALRWRRPEARLALALALTPGTPVGYENVAWIAFVPQTLPQMLALLALDHVSVWVGIARIAGATGDARHAAWFAAYGPLQVWMLYLPALAMILRRPNAGAAAATPERSPTRGALPVGQALTRTAEK